MVLGSISIHVIEQAPNMAAYSVSIPKVSSSCLLTLWDTF